MEPTKRARVEDGAPAAAAAPRRPRVALIHGGCSNPFIFRKQLKHLLAALGETVELVEVSLKPAAWKGDRQLDSFLINQGCMLDAVYT